MPRRTTQLSAFNRWRRNAQSWLTDSDAPYVALCQDLARAQDAEVERKGYVQAATASAYRHALVQLDARRPDGPASAGAPFADEDSGLFGPAMIDD